MRRLKELRKAFGYSQQKLADFMTVSRSTIAMWETGKSQPDNESLSKLAFIFNTSTDDLLEHTVYPDTPQSTGGIWVPVLGTVAAGIPIDAIEEVVDYEEISTEMAAHGEHFALKIKGDSMEPRIKEGDIVIVRKQSVCDTGDTVVALVNGSDATVKRIKKRPEGIMLIPNNNAYEPKFYSNNDVETLPVTIIGKVIELRAKL